MIYLDTSVALAWLLTEDRRLPASLWDGTLVSSRLLEYEIWTTLHAPGLADSHGEASRGPVGRVALLELSPRVLARALEAFPGPAPLRTLDAFNDVGDPSRSRLQGPSMALRSLKLTSGYGCWP